MKDFNLEFAKNIDYFLKQDTIIKFTPSNVCDSFLNKFKKISTSNLLLLLSQFYKINNKTKRYYIITKLLLNYIYISIAVQCNDKGLYNKSRKYCILYWRELMRFMIDDHKN